MPVHVSSYEGGIDRDSSKNKYPKGSYYKMKNFRLVSFDELSNGSVNSIKGNTPITITGGNGYDDHTVIGHIVIRNYLVAWSTNCHDDIGGRGVIWRTDLSVPSPIWTIIRDDVAMMLTTKHPIAEECIGYYESSTIIKVYWTDYFNMYRFVNIAVPFTGTIDQLNILPNVSFDPPVVTNISTGNIYVGKVQYAYQYFNVHGVETTFSSCTPLIHLTQSSESLSGSLIRSYQGTDALDSAGNPNISGKAVTIKIVNTDTNYDKIRIVAILYRNYKQEPEIHIVGEYVTTTNLIISDIGVYTLGTLSLNAFRTLGNAELYCKTISQKGNKALIGNITEKFFDVTFDARAYRYVPVAELHESFYTITPVVGDIDDGLSTNTKLYFSVVTPGSVSAKTNDAMGDNSALTRLTINYSETVSGDSNTGIQTGYDGTYITFSYNSNNKIDVSISSFQNFITQVFGIPITQIISDVDSISATASVSGHYYRTDTSRFSYSDTSSNTSNMVYNHGADTLTFTVTKSFGNYFSSFDHFDTDGQISFSIEYDYDSALRYSTVYTSSDVAFHKTNFASNPVNWTWYLQKNLGNFIPCIGAFNSNKITSISMSIDMDYTYTTTEGKIIVYDIDYSGEHEIVQSDTPGWPNNTFRYLGANVPDDDDCICPYNIDMTAVPPAIDEVATYSDTNHSAKYQDKACTIIGGIGPNIKYEFINETMAIEKSPDPRYGQPDVVTINDLTSFASFKNPFIEANMMHYKYDEVYRHGIVLTNTKGQDSFVKWIGDIKTPPMITGGTYKGTIVYAGGTYICNAFPLGIKFTINTASLIAAGVVGMRIVRVERTNEDKTIITQGVASNMYHENSGLVANPYYDLIMGYPRVCNKKPTEGTDHAKYVQRPDIVQFISPEINYLKNLVPVSTDYIKVCARLNTRLSFLTCVPGNATPYTEIVLGINERNTILPVGGGGNTFAGLYDTSPWVNVSKYLTTYVTGLTTLPIYKIVEGVIAGTVEYGAELDNRISFASTNKYIVNRSFDFTAADALNHQGISGTCAILSLANDALTNHTIVDDANVILNSADELEIFLLDYKRPGVALSMYGGITYEARQQNTYIDCGIYTAISGGIDVMNVYGGDTYIDFFEHLRTMWEVDDNDGDNNPDVSWASRFCSIVKFPCETTINLGLDNGFKFSNNYNTYYIHALRETIGSWNGDWANHVGPFPQHDYDLVQDKNMYVYNTVYSQPNTSKIYFYKPNDWLSIVQDDTNIKISLEKSPREDVDSYLKYLTDNQKILPTQFGAINDLFLFKNYMMVFFDHAFGTISIDERATLPIQNNSILELGIANNLQFFDFISDISGSIHPSSINRIGEGFGWFDAYNGSFGFYNGQTQDIGMVHGLSSDIKSYSELIRASDNTFYHNQLYGGNFLTFENRKYKESFCAMVVSELADWFSNTATTTTFTLQCSPGTLYNTAVMINGVESIADTTGTKGGVGTLTINTSDNPSFVPGIVTPGKYFIYYKDLSTVFSFSSITGNYQFELDVFPQYLIQYNEDLFEIIYRKVIYKENYGNFGEFYGMPRQGVMEYIINPAGSSICLFNNYSYTMELLESNGINERDNTWNSISMYNDYQWSISNATICTFTVASQKFTKTSHGLAINSQVMLSGVIPFGLSTSVVYYTVNVNTNDFKLSLTKGGTPIALVDSGTCNYHTLDIPLTLDSLTVPGNVHRRFRTWHLKDLRDWRTDKPRMRDSYIRIIFKYQHGSNTKLIMHDLNTFYQIIRESYEKNAPTPTYVRNI